MSKRQLKSSSAPVYVPTEPQPRRPLHPETMSATTTNPRSKNPTPARRLRNNASTTLDNYDCDSESDSNEENDNGSPTHGDLNMIYGDTLRGHSYEYVQNTIVQPTPVQPQPPVVKEPEKSSFSWWAVCSILMIAIIAWACYLYFKVEPLKVDDKVDPPINRQLYSDINTIQNDFPSQVRNIWPGFIAGIESVLLSDATTPSVFLLMHNDNEAVSSCLARRVAHVARRLMGANSEELLVLDGEKLGGNKSYAEDRGRFIEDYKPLVENHRIMILNNLQLLPADLARSLHIFCDQVTPLVPQAIYIFTLNARQSWRGSNTKMAESQLNAAWNQLDSDIRQPLIVRVTSGAVVNVAPEYNARTCD